MNDRIFNIKRGDTSPVFKYQLLDNNGSPIDLSRSDVKLIMRDYRNETIIEDDTAGNVTILDAENGKVKYDWKSSDTDDTGEFTAEWEVTHDNNRVETFPNDGYITVKIIDDIR